MAINPPKGPGRIGAVRYRKQAFNPKTKRWVEINTKTHKIINQMDVKYKPFKGVRKYP